MITISQERMLVYYAIGVATTQWSGVEYGVGLVAATCLQAPDISAVMRSFRAIENFRSKLAYANEAVSNSALLPIIAADWARLHTRIEGLAKLRNRIAHNELIGYLEAQEGRRWVLVSRHDRVPSPSGSPPSSALGATSIHQAARQFARAGAALHDIVDLAHNRELLHGAEFQQERPPLKLAQLASQMRQEFSPLP